ncbi:hypothetical protein JTE90_006232 [Oedothorax gibbosus]|uniref:Reverse transcriptase domain-containing protein n=1 Tax=Oedothorax gibbosus TaxID=931172 RepID=A0AAV6VTY0_9ARAC|nr:hypothetical protein JTE90_006232 [Oedothorax gibbosus]
MASSVPNGGTHTSASASILLDWISDSDLCLLNLSSPTYYKPRCRPSLLDLTICSPDIFNLLHFEILNDMFESDHCPIKITVSNACADLPTRRIRVNWHQFNSRININLASCSSMAEITTQLASTAERVSVAQRMPRVAQANALALALVKPRLNSYIPLDFSGPTTDLDADFTFTELEGALRKTGNKSPGPDRVSAQMIKSLNHENKMKLLKAYNAIWNSGQVPEQWKLSKIIPIVKPGKPSSLTSSYRPISLTSIPCKVMERMILHRLICLYQRKLQFDPFQSGFLQYRGCENLIAALHHLILTAKAKKNYVIGISLDINAAYDNTWHDGLLYKVLRTGVRGKQPNGSQAS